MLSLLGQSKFSLQVSVPLVVGYEAALKRGHKIFYLWRPTLKEPDDDFLLELAVKAQASIVTWHMADFKKADKFGISIMTPRDLLKQLEKST